MIRANLDWYAGPVLMVAITPPGVDVLPWACAADDHEHSGPAGCQVEEEAADRWAGEARGHWKALREDCRLATVRATGQRPTLLVRVWEPQKRGVPHLHVVLGVKTPAERLAAWRFIEELRERVPAHGFGFVQQKVQESAGAGAARYLTGYLLGRSRRKGTIRENISHPRMPRQLVYVQVALTRVTRCNMRRMRLARWYLRALAGRASMLPRLRGADAIDVARAVTLLEHLRGRGDDDDEPAKVLLLDEAGRLIGPRVAWHVRTIRVMRQLAVAA